MKKIQVIDAEELVLESWERLLKKHGYAATLVRNGKEAMDELEINDFDLIVSDIRMPKASGKVSLCNYRRRSLIL